MRRAVLWSVALAVGSLWLVAPAPSYDPWAWLLWGRELAHGMLVTGEGPAFKPLPTFVAVLLSPLGGLGPEAWVAVARSGAVLAVVLAHRLGRELGGSRVAGVLAALGVVTTAGFIANAGEGLSEGLLLGLALAAWSLARAGRRRGAVGAAVGCALLRVETWPFLLVWAAADAARRRRPRPGVSVLAVLVPAAWFVPEWAGSGQLLRSASRARVPSPGQPALARFPAWASLRGAVALPPWPAWVGLVALAIIGVLAFRTGLRSRRSGAGALAPDACAGRAAPDARAGRAAPGGTVAGTALDGSAGAFALRGSGGVAERRMATGFGEGDGRVGPFQRDAPAGGVERDGRNASANAAASARAAERDVSAGGDAIRASAGADGRDLPAGVAAAAEGDRRDAPAGRAGQTWTRERSTPSVVRSGIGAVIGPAAVGLAWMALVAVMAQAGFSGEVRYAMPGAAAIAASGGVGLAVAGRWLWGEPGSAQRSLLAEPASAGRLPAAGTGPAGRWWIGGPAPAGRRRSARPVASGPGWSSSSASASAGRGIVTVRVAAGRGNGPESAGGAHRRSGLVTGGAPARALRLAASVVGLAAMAACAFLRLDDLFTIRDAQAYQRRLQTSLPAAIAAAGGRDAVVACGTPFVGPIRGPVFAYALRLPKPEVEPDARPGPPGMVFRSALHEGAPPAPEAPTSFQPAAAVGPWEVLANCGR